MECIEWWGARFNNGYGALYRSGKTQKAHRVIWEECYGPIPDGLWVLHRCDNPPCVNPMHLFLGTAQDNTDDMEQKGRARRPGAPRREFCKWGHEFTAENTIITKRRGGGVLRGCRECGRRRSREHYQRKKQHSVN